MAEAETTENAAPAPDKPKRSAKGLLIGVGLALALGGGGFYAAYSGMLPIGGGHAEPQVTVPEVAFVPIPAVLINLGAAASGRHLRFQGELEVEKPASADVTHLLPRIQDVLNGYLRAVEVSDLEDPSALIRLRAQMLRRIQVVVGEGRVRDLLVTEFVLN